ncbi:MAG: ribonuclease III [Kiritimatiellia bacterium]
MFGRSRLNPYRDLEKDIGHSFRRREHLTAALTHRSYRFENPGTECDNQRLEFLGDAVLGLVTAAHLYEKFTEADEGTLTHLRSSIASGKALARVAKRIGLGDRLLLGRGEERSGGRNRDSNLADVLESVIGAVYVDGGFKAADKMIRKLVTPELAASGDDVWEHNPKGKLQEIAQRVWHCSPHYRNAGEKGPSHARVFTVDVLLDGNVMGRGRGMSKREAEASAAIAAMAKMAELPEAEQGAF